MNSLLLHGYIEGWLPLIFLLTMIISCLVILWRGWHPERHPLKLFVVGMAIVCLLLWHERVLRGHRALTGQVMFSNDGPYGIMQSECVESAIRPVTIGDYAIVLLMASAAIMGGIFIWRECEE